MVKKKHGLPETIPGALYGCPPHSSEQQFSDEELKINAALEETVRVLLQRLHGTASYEETAIRLFETIPPEVRRTISMESRETIIKLLTRQQETT